MAHVGSRSYALQSFWSTILKQPVIVKNNVDYCLTNRQTSFSENSLFCLHTGGGWGPTNWSHIGEELWAWSGGLGVTSFNSWSHPELYTFPFPLPLHETGSRKVAQAPSARPVFPMPPSKLQFHTARVNLLLVAAKLFTPPTATNRFFVRCEIKAPTSATLPFKHFWVGGWALLQIPSLQSPPNTQNAKKQCSVISLWWVLSRFHHLFCLSPWMQQLSAESLGTSSLLSKSSD